jgi:LIVCS family branched-chain amino acid:cation transporter
MSGWKLLRPLDKKEKVLKKMDQKKLSFTNYVFVGSMLFGLFFGAANLIFPVFLGQHAGSKTPIANLGFLLTAVGLPFLGILAMSLTNSNGVHDLASKVGKRYADVFTILLYATIGPFFAMPRLATVSFENGIKPYVPEGSSTIVLLLYSILFFGVAYLFSRKPSNLMEYVGKWLNPACLLLLGILLILALINPLGALDSGASLDAYKATPFVQGLKDGYNTMDVLASLAFGIIVISTLKNLGVKKSKDITVGALKSGLVVVFLMAVIYTAMSFMGATSLGHFKPAENGAIALSQLSKQYLGGFGSLLFAVIVILVTLKTTIGLIVAIGEAIVDFNQNIPYQKAIIVISILPMIFANAGLDLILQWSIPVLMFIYPLSITLMLMALLEPLMGYRKPVYVWTSVFAVFAAIFDAFNAVPDGVKEFGLVKSLLNIGSHLPLFTHGLGWLVPSLIGFAIGFLLSLRTR